MKKTMKTKLNSKTYYNEISFSIKKKKLQQQWKSKIEILKKLLRKKSKNKIFKMK